MSRQFILLILLFFCLNSFCQSWEKATLEKQATLNCYWFTSIPFIYQDEAGQLQGIEFELMSLFQEYLEQTKGIRLSVNWIENENFSGIMDKVSEKESPNFLGLSAFSITEDRRKYLQFTDAYLPDVMVLVSSKGTPIMSTNKEIQQMLKQMQAVTIKGTTYEKMLLELRVKLDIPFEIIYIESDKNILGNIKDHGDRFGFIDLPIYLMLVKNGGELTRQNFFTVQGTGYGLIMPQSSDWNIPLNSFLSDGDYQARLKSIMSRYLGQELFVFIDQLAPHKELGTSILTKEKELQLAVIKNANLKLEESESFRRVLIAGIVATALFLLIIIVLFMNNHRNTKILLAQKTKIESQQQDIRNKNEQLINRNVQLIKLNEDKNNLVKILAHDLRSPLNQIIGFGDVLQSQAGDFSHENQEILSHINNAAVRMEKMISKILNTDNAEHQHSMVLKEHVDVSNLLEGLVDRYQSVASKKDIQIICAPFDYDILLLTDHMLLFLIMENLISNAIKFSERNTKIQIHIEKKADAVVFEVKDEGPGISSEDQAKAFRRFQKLSAQPTDNEQSTGLGLSIVKKYVTDLGGQVWIKSTLGQGSSFLVSLPNG